MGLSDASYNRNVEIAMETDQVRDDRTTIFDHRWMLASSPVEDIPA
jgi:hypothetical protein